MKNINSQIEEALQTPVRYVQGKPQRMNYIETFENQRQKISKAERERKIIFREITVSL